jgi:cytidine deaminase
MTPFADADLQAMVTAARAASARAHCPYSRFPVGAAVLTNQGTIVAGCNVENASFGLTICAERSAVVQAVAGGATAIRAVVVYTPTPEPTAPCGACRQVLNEFGPEAQVFCVCEGPRIIRATVASLLPRAFGPQNLESSR